MTMDLIRSAKNQTRLVEEVRNRTANLNKKNWKIEFKWVKAHVGMHGNEIADRLAKEATQKYQVTYRMIAKCTIEKDNWIESIRNGKVNGRKQRKERLLKNFFPSVEGSLAVNLN